MLGHYKKSSIIYCSFFHRLVILIKQRQSCVDKGTTGNKLDSAQTVKREWKCRKRIVLFSQWLHSTNSANSWVCSFLAVRLRILGTPLFFSLTFFFLSCGTILFPLLADSFVNLRHARRISFEASSTQGSHGIKKKKEEKRRRVLRRLLQVCFWKLCIP